MAERPEHCHLRDGTSGQFAGSALSAADQTVVISAARPNASSPSHDRIRPERPPRVRLPQSEATLPWRRLGVAMAESDTAASKDDHGGSSCLHHINLVDENSCSSTLYCSSSTMSHATTCTMDLSLLQVMPGGGQEDGTAAMTGEGDQQDNAAAGGLSAEFRGKSIIFVLHCGNINFNFELVVPQVNKVGQTLIVPEIGMTFDSENNAYDMYNTYAGKVGFSIS